MKASLDRVTRSSVRLIGSFIRVCHELITGEPKARAGKPYGNEDSEDEDEMEE